MTALKSKKIIPSLLPMVDKNTDIKDFLLIFRKSSFKRILLENLTKRNIHQGYFGFLFDTDLQTYGISPYSTNGNMYVSYEIMDGLCEYGRSEKQLNPIVEDFIKRINGTMDTDRRIQYLILDDKKYNEVVKSPLSKCSFVMISRDEIRGAFME